jgi:hypothetical protein
MRVKKNKKGLVPLDNFLKSLAVCGNFARAAESAGVSDKQLEQWFNHHDICRMMAEARANAQLRKNFIAPCMTREQFDAIRESRICCSLGRAPMSIHECLFRCHEAVSI